MPDERPYVAQNAEARERLAALVGRLTDEDFNHDVGGGWQVSTLLAHLAFWDRRVAAVLERWERDGKPTPSPVDDDPINEALGPIWTAVQPREAARLALEAAELADTRLATLSAALVDAALARDVLNPFRGEHRLEHIEQIERALRG
jgi:hypothetical protein